MGKIRKALNLYFVLSYLLSPSLAAELYKCEKENPCENGSTCVMAIDNLGRELVACSCRLGYSGKYCSYLIASPECESSPCKNGGECKAATEGYRCKCVGGFIGDNCEINEKEERKRLIETGQIPQSSDRRLIVTVSVMGGVVILALLCVFCGRVQAERQELLEAQASLAGLCDRPDIETQKTDICSVALRVLISIFKSCVTTVKREPYGGLNRRSFTKNPSNLSVLSRDEIERLLAASPLSQWVKDPQHRRASLPDPHLSHSDFNMKGGSINKASRSCPGQVNQSPRVLSANDNRTSEFIVGSKRNLSIRGSSVSSAKIDKDLP